MRLKFSIPFLPTAILLVTALIFSQCLSFSFVNWDDDTFLSNPLIQATPFSNLWEIFTHHSLGRYYPLTMLGFQIQHHFFDFQPLFYHLVNLLLHLANIIWIFKIFKNLGVGGKIACSTVFLFAIHPLQVESVAWISSFKDLLFSFFFLWAVFIYTLQPRRPSHLFHVFVLYFLALSAKIAAVSLPLLLILLDYCEKKKIEICDGLQKIPLLILAAFFVIMNLLAADAAHAFSVSQILSWIDGVWLSGYALAVYVLKIFLPFSLCAYYPLPPQTHGFFAPEIYIIALAVLLLSLLFLKIIRHDLKLITAFLAFLIMMAPSLHLVKINNCVIYERFVYLPSLGFFFLISVWMSSLLTKTKTGKFRYPTRMLMLAYFCFLIITSWTRCPAWANSETLWTDVVEKRPASPVGYFYRASHYLQERRLEEAARDIHQAIKLHPAFEPSYQMLDEIQRLMGGDGTGSAHPHAGI